MNCPKARLNRIRLEAVKGCHRSVMRLGLYANQGDDQVESPVWTNAPPKERGVH